MDEQNWRYDQFAAEMNISIHQLDDLLVGDLEINSVLADKLSAILGSTPEFWLERERQYREALCESKRI